MELSLRMQEIAAMATPCPMAADIGCDHGYILLDLVERGIAERGIAMDVRTGPLSHAAKNIRQRHMEDKIQCRRSDGLEGLTPGEADLILMTGMGGPLIMEILEQGRKKLLGAETLILQPQSDIPGVRRYLHRIDYGITEERMVKEEGKYYTALKAVNRKEPGSTDAEYRYGACLLRQKSPVLYEYLEKEEAQLTILAASLSQQTSERAEKRLEEIRSRLAQNREARGYYES